MLVVAIEIVHIHHRDDNLGCQIWMITFILKWRQHCSDTISCTCNAQTVNLKQTEKRKKKRRALSPPSLALQTDRRSGRADIGKICVIGLDFVCSGHFEFLVGAPAVQAESHIRVVATRCQETHRSILFDGFLKIPPSRIYEGFFVSTTSSTCTTLRGTVCPSKDHK